MAYETADTAPLAEALTKIGKIADQSESDGMAMLEMLNEISELAGDARVAYRESVMAAQKAELAELRARAAEQNIA